MATPSCARTILCLHLPALALRAPMPCACAIFTLSRFLASSSRPFALPCAYACTAISFFVLLSFFGRHFALWQSLNKTRTFRRQKPFCKNYERYEVSFISWAEKFLLTTQNWFDMMVLFSGQSSLSEGFTVP